MTAISKRRMLRSAVAGAVLAAAACGGTAPAFAADRALIMTISDYQGPAALPGVTLDAGNARKILVALGFADNHVTVPKSAELSLSGMRRALETLGKETADGDRVFVYFSGHGTSYASGDRCEQALVSSDLKALPAAELFKFLSALRDRASRVILVLDACFSGGIAEAMDLEGTGARATPRYVAKYTQLPSESHSCAVPVNIELPPNTAARGIKGAVNLDRNYAVVAAARHDEAAFDDRLRGGVATTSIVDCLAASEADADHSGSVSIGELSRCAQGKIDRRFPSSDRLRQHLVLSGNAAMPVAEPSDSSQEEAANPKATLNDVLQGADARWDVRVTASSRKLRLKQDSFDVSVTSSRAGYLYVVYVGSDNHEFLKLYPTRDSEPNRIEAGIPFAVPKRWHSEGPAGTDSLLFLVSAAPRELKSIFGPSLTAAGTYAGARGLNSSLRGCADRTGPCLMTQSRNLSGSDSPTSTGSGATGYGAALLTIAEVAP